eukprot:638040_1
MEISEDTRDVCIWGRHTFPNIIVNGKYKYKSNFDSYPWYVQDIDWGWTMEEKEDTQAPKQLHLWHLPLLDADFYVITFVAPPNPKLDGLIAQCGFVNSTHPTECGHSWHMYIGGESQLEHDLNVTATYAPCPQWDCDSISVHGLYGSGCNLHFEERIAPNAWQNKKVGRYWYFLPSVFRWVCRDSYDLSSKMQSNVRAYTNNSANGWIDLSGGENITLSTTYRENTSTTHVVQCWKHSAEDDTMLATPAGLPHMIPIVLTLFLGAIIYHVMKRISAWKRLRAVHNINQENANQINEVIQRIVPSADPTQIDQGFAGVNESGSTVEDHDEWKEMEEARDILMAKLSETLTDEVVSVLLNKYHYLLHRCKNNKIYSEIMVPKPGNDEFAPTTIKDTSARPQINRKHVHCQVETCRMFLRNYRKRSDFKSDAIMIGAYGSSKDPQYIARRQIADKIHCFCYHFNLLSVNEQNDSIYMDIWSTIQNRMDNKYNQLYRDMEGEDASFIFGMEIRYVSRSSNVDDITNFDCIQMTMKYPNLKRELIDNAICIVTSAQFDQEFYKAKIHWNGYFRRKYFPDYSVQHLLSVMIYCDFDHLQRCFSKTYRELDGESHRNYWHLGKTLKETVLGYGTRLKDGNINGFHHGVTQKLVPTQLVGHLGKGVSIFCPLSTSSSLAVAMQFSQTNEGIVMTFGGKSRAKYFSVNWLSDYANEHEHLFLQNKEELEIQNIIECATNFEYHHILNGFKAIDFLFAESHYFESITAERMSLIMCVINLQLSTANNDTIESLNSEYARKLIKVYFDEKKKVTIHYSILERKYSDLFKKLCYVDYEWINIEVLNKLFPKISDIEIGPIRLCAKTMQDISGNRGIFYGSNDSWNLDKMTLKVSKNSEMTASKAVECYKKQFKENNVRLTIRQLPNWDSNEYDTIVIE